MAFSGACSYVFLASASRSLGPVLYSRLAAAWTLMYVLEPACLAPVAQVMARNLAGGRVKDDRAFLQSALRTGVTIVAIVCALGLALAPVVPDAVFDGDATMYLLVLLGVPCQFGLALAWGFSTGRSRYATCARLVAVDAAVRLATAVVLGSIGVATPSLFALTFVLGPLASLLWNRHAIRPPRGDRLDGGAHRAAGRAVAHQMFSSAIAIAMLSSGPLLVKVLAGADGRGEAGRFQNAASVTQAPLLVLSSVLVVLLPHLSELAACGDHRRLGVVVGKVLGVHAVISSVAVLAGARLGPLALRIAYGPEYVVPATDLAVLVAAAACFFGTQVVGQGLLALREERRNDVCQVVGGFTMAVAVAAGRGVFDRVAVGFLAGSAAAYATGVVMLASGVLRRTWPAQAARSGPATASSARARLRPLNARSGPG